MQEAQKRALYYQSKKVCLLSCHSFGCWLPTPVRRRFGVIVRPSQSTSSCQNSRSRLEKTAVTSLYPSVQTWWSGMKSTLRSTPIRSRKGMVTVKTFLMTRLVRCDVLDDSSCNIRWKMTFIPSGSTWIYSLAKSAGWEIRTKSPDPSSVAVFSWRSVFSSLVYSSERSKQAP